MFSVRDKALFAVSFVLVFAGFLLMGLDPVENGFGALTLWVAPPLLVAGFALPIVAMASPRVSAGNARVPGFKHLMGIATFVVPMLVYLSTLEPTASLWDCSEFIASAFKLQVPHTPGTPLSLLVGRLFAMAAVDLSNVAWMLNFMSAFFSAMTVCLLYYVIFTFAERMLNDSENDPYAVAIASAGGALCLAFSDTFWFSAVEAETYGPASFFLVLIFWLIITGPRLAEPSRSRRLILIFYIAGLGYCIHPMCLLALTVFPFVWFAKERAPTLRFLLLTVGAGVMLVFVINRFVVIGLFELAFSFDLFFVNVLGLPFYSGAGALLLLMVAMFWFGVRRSTHIRPYLLSLVFLLAGFVPYTLLFIRSSHNPPIDETNPENLAMIRAYMNRESYPASPLMFGPYFDARITDVHAKKRIYYPGMEEYSLAGTLPEYVYDGRKTILPRMYSNDEDHIKVPLPPNAPMPIQPIVNVFTQQLDFQLFRNCVPGFTTTMTPTLETCSAAMRIILVASTGLPDAYQRDKGNGMCLSVQANPAWQAQLLAVIDAYVARGGLDAIAAARAGCVLAPAAP
jgi:hypothetical protein